MIHFFHHYKDVALVWFFTISSVTLKQVNERLTTISLTLAICYTAGKIIYSVYKFVKSKE